MYSVPLRVRPAAFDLDFLATGAKSSMRRRSFLPQKLTLGLQSAIKVIHHNPGKDYGDEKHDNREHG